MTEAPAFDLKALIREVAAESAHADPGALAEEVDKRVPDEHLREAFREMLRQFVRQMVVTSRTFPAPTVRDAAEPAQASSPAPARPANRSWKRNGIYKWASVLRERVHVGVGAADWKFLGDCDREDLGFIAEERRALAEANIVKAEQYEKLRALLDEHRAATVRELPEQALEDTFGGAE